MMTIKEKIRTELNGKTSMIIIYILGFAFTVSTTLFIVGKVTGTYQNKVDTLEKQTVPQINIKVDTAILNQSFANNKILNLLQELKDSIDASRYSQRSMEKDILRINKKLKIE